MLAIFNTIGQLVDGLCRDHNIAKGLSLKFATSGGLELKAQWAGHQFDGLATVFSKLDANSGFWQVPLDPLSELLTTFITPFGRFCFHRLPFGISSAPEIFQRLMSQMLAGLPGTVCMIG